MGDERARGTGPHQCAPTAAPVRVVIIEDDHRYRDGIETLFEHASGFELSASFASATAALAVAREAVHGWDVALVDVDLPGLNGIDATRRLKELRPELQVLMLTVFEAPRTMMQAICAGACGYVLKRTSARQLLEQTMLAMNGGPPLSAAVARSLLLLVRELGEPARPGSGPTRLALTGRERDVLRGLTEGKSYQEVGDTLGVHIDSVRTHVRNLYRKLEVHTAAEAVARALREQLL